MDLIRSFRTHYRGLMLVVLLTVIAWLMLIIGEVLPDLDHVTQGFAAYYTASYAVLHGGAAALTDDNVFGVWLRRAGIGLHEVFAGNVPTLALLTIPFTAVSPNVAQSLWLILNVGMLGIAIWVAVRLCAAHNVAAGWWIAAVFALLAPVHESIRFGQVYLLLALLSLVAMASLRDRHETVAGIAVASMILIKPYYGLLMVGLLLWVGRWRSMAVTMVAIVVVVIISMPLLAQAWIGFPRAEVNISDIAWAGIPANQTLNSLSQHLWMYTPVWNPEPLTNLPWLAVGLHFGSMIALVSITLWQARKHRDDSFWIWPPALTLMPVLAPIGEVHHLSMLLLPIAVGVTTLVERKSGKYATLLIVTALILLIIPWPSLHDTANWAGWRGLFAYPRLAGAILLWAALTLKSVKKAGTV